jgi:X-domain of DnaJ-containing
MAWDNTPWGVGGWLHSAKSTAHVFRRVGRLTRQAPDIRSADVPPAISSETWSTIRTAMELQTVFKELSAAEDKGLSEEQRKDLEERAAAKGMLALFKVGPFSLPDPEADLALRTHANDQGAKLEIESVVREVCDRVLGDPDASKEERRLRAVALGEVTEPRFVRQPDS